MIWPQLSITLWPFLALCLAPIIWWISRLLPPEPRKIIFPAAQFLAGLSSERQSANDAPIWLKILRIFGLCALIFAFTNPILAFEKQNSQALPRNIIFILEDSYTIGPDFDNRQLVLKNVFENLRVNTKIDTQFFILKTSIQTKNGDNFHLEPMDINRAAVIAQNTNPAPLFLDHRNAAIALRAFRANAKIYYFSDGLEHSNSDSLLGAIREKSAGKAEIYAPSINLNAALIDVRPTQTGFDFRYLAANTKQPLRVDFYSQNNVILASKNGAAGRGSLNLDTSIARKVAFAKINGVNSAAAVFLFDSFDKRPRIGVEKSSQSEQPILSDNHYIKAAAMQFSDVYENDIEKLVAARTDAIIVGDRAGFSPSETGLIEKYIKDGGTLIRYIGPQAIAANDELLPAKFKSEPRNIKDALNVKPIVILPFSRQSPLFGLELPNDANPTMVASLNETTETPIIWAQLSDGTPFVSARKLGKGEIVAIHTSAAPYWSDIAFSGLQVGILKRLVSRAKSPILPSQIRPTELPLKPLIMLDGFGNIIKAPKSAKPIEGQIVSAKKANSGALPGIYENVESRLIVQGLAPDTKFIKAKKLGPEFSMLKIEAVSNLRLQPFLFLIALCVFLIDGLLALGLLSLLRGFWSKISQPKLRPILALIFAAVFALYSPYDANAQSLNLNNKNSAAPKNGMTMAYIMSHERENDEITKNGLSGLMSALNNRTSVRASKVIGIDPRTLEPNNNNLALLPIIYWRLGDNPAPLSHGAQQALNQYMRNGGLLFIDTRGAGQRNPGARANTQIALRGLIIPPLEIVSQSHVLTKSFYLLSGFPGRYSGARLWAQSRASLDTSANDGVSPIVIGDGDYAYAWAQNSPQNNINNGALGRNAAINTGINIYLYALTGQYKADQVHIPAILERLSKRPKR